jgi:hypothetical protein
MQTTIFQDTIHRRRRHMRTCPRQLTVEAAIILLDERGRLAQTLLGLIKQKGAEVNLKRRSPHLSDYHRPVISARHQG